MATDSDSDADSLFDDKEDVASLSKPPIPGLFFFADLLPRELCGQVLTDVANCSYFAGNQAMLFGRASRGESRSGLPAWADELIESLAKLLAPQLLDKETFRLLFPTQAPGDIDEDTQPLSRQLILNLYSRGEGLTPHVDLLRRFADGIILCSFGAEGQGTVMRLEKVDGPDKYDVYLPPRSVLILSGEARYDWKHGIPAREADLVDLGWGVEELQRGSRLSITIRWLLPGADVVGAPDRASSET